MDVRCTFTRCTLSALAFTLLPSPGLGFADVRLDVTPYSRAIQALQEKGVIEGYEDGTFKPTAHLNRAEFLKIVLESRGTAAEGEDCFPDVKDQWFAPYVCEAKEEGVIDGYPDGTFKPDRTINFAEASKILSKAFGQEIEDFSPDWYEPFIRALENSRAIPLSIERLEQEVSRGEMAEMMWRLTEGKTDQPSKGYLNVKYQDVMINMASEEPQRASSCADLKAFTQEANRRPAVLFYEEEMPTMALPAIAGGTMEKARVLDFSQTNVQVSGVDEADVVKTDGTYLYAALEGKVRIVRAYPADAVELLSTIDLQEDPFSPTELYIDGNRLIVIGSARQTYDFPAGGTPGMAKMIAPPFLRRNRTEVRIYGIEDRSNPSLLRTLSFDGRVVSTRKIGTKLTVVMNEDVRWNVPKPIPMPMEKDLLPSFRDSAAPSGEEPVSRCGDVIILPRVPRPQYLIVAVIPTDSVEGDVRREVVLGSAENIYSSAENLYVAALQRNYSWGAPSIESREQTDIYRFAFADQGVELKAHGTVPGHVLNQFSMDEYEGHFRIATTQTQRWDATEPSASIVTVLDADLEPLGKIEGIAPGETMYSARFVGNRAYLVTFKKTDPFFVLDLSDPRNPRILGQLKIPGYSDYLHPYDENVVIGFGKEAEEAKDPTTGLREDFAWYQGMKMALFDVTDPQNPKELHRFTIGDRGTESPLLSDHRALLFEKDRELLAFPVQVHKLAKEQKEASAGDAWGEPVFQGAYVFRLNLNDGFLLKGTISHYDRQDYLKAGSMFFGKNIERILRIGDSLLTLSPYGVQSHSLDTLNLEADVPFEGANATSKCPNGEDESCL